MLKGESHALDDNLGKVKQTVEKLMMTKIAHEVHGHSVKSEATKLKRGIVSDLSKQLKDLEEIKRNERHKTGINLAVGEEIKFENEESDL